MSNLDTTNTEIPTPLTPEAEAVNDNLPIEEGQEGTEEGNETEVEDDLKQEKLKKQSRLDRRFKDLTTKVKSAAADAQSWRETLTEVTGQPPPNRADYADQNDYLQAIDDYREAIRGPKTMLDQAEKVVKQASTELQATLMEKWEDRVSEIEDELPNYHEIVSKTDLPISTVLQTAILKHKEGPKIVYYLATHPETARELVSLPIEEQILELSEIASKKVRTGRSVAPVEDNEIDPPAPPPSRRSSGDPAPRKKDPGQMSIDEYSAWRKAGGGR